MSEEQKHRRDLSRRRVLVLGGGAVVAAGIGAGVVGTASAGGTDDTAAEGCYRLTSETTEGPYYIDADKIRKDITEGKEGIPLTLRLKVIDAESCKPLKGVAVDVWHCDALGIYSGYESLSTGGGGGGGGTPPSGEPPTGAPPTGTPPTGTPPTGGPGGGGGGHEEPTDDSRYLRGTQLTGSNGVVEFTTVFPGWYRGRCVHIHTKVHVGGTMTSSGYEGGNTCHTGQLFFDEAAVLDAAAVAPYSAGTTERTTLDQDTIYPGNGAEGGLLSLKYKKGRIAGGVVATLTMGVDPEATHTGTDG
ncbi:intradiol ring-cleavage dioxygenase [Streptomyces sp. NPDC051771]|uniref:intradiol ring-cleavage dioxygenase n=1 Tax=Streptomyces sp. NPDC051771 TaxID=3154847 RepID=UPI0034485D71